MFFEERLTPQQRDYLESLSADAMKTELIKMYYAGRFRGGFPRPPGPGGPSGRDGPGRNGPGREGPRRDGLPGRANPGDERRPPPIFTPSPFIPGNRGPGSGEKNDRQNQD